MFAQPECAYVRRVRERKRETHKHTEYIYNVASAALVSRRRRISFALPAGCLLTDSDCARNENKQHNGSRAICLN